MPTFTVKEASSQPKPDKGFGPMQSITLKLQEYGQADEVGAEWYTKATTAVPQPGSTIEGELSPSQYGMKFKKSQQGFAGGGRVGGMSPERERQIIRQHSQHMALQYASIRQAQGLLPEEFSLADLGKIADWFDRDVAQAKGRVEGQG